MNLDMKSLAHMGTEIVVIGGVAFWLNKNISDVKNKVNSLESIITAQSAHIKSLTELVVKHEQVLQRLFSKDLSPIPDIQNADDTKQKDVDTNKSKEVEDKTKNEGSKNRSKRRKAPKKNITPEDKDISPEDIDKIIQEELQKELLHKNDEIMIETIEDKSLKQKKKEK